MKKIEEWKWEGKHNVVPILVKNPDGDIAKIGFKNVTQNPDEQQAIIIQINRKQLKVLFDFLKDFFETEYV